MPRLSTVLILLVSAVLVASLTMAGLALQKGSSASKNERMDICHAVNGTRQVLRNYFDVQFGRARLNLPRISYYQHHPAELRRQLILVDEQQRELNTRLHPIVCTS